MRCARPLLCREVAQRAQDPGDASGAQLQALDSRPGANVLGQRGSRGGADALTGEDRSVGEGAGAPGEALSDRESAVLERIEAFRRRRPRFRDDIVTMAHGAGGKASAALIDAVFLDPFGGLDRPPLTDSALIALPEGGTIAFTTDSFVVN